MVDLLPVYLTKRGYKMKKFIFLSLLAIAMVTPTFAHNNNAKAYWNAITLYNGSPYKIYYTFSTLFTFWPWNKTYTIKPGETDVYHSGIGDTDAYLSIRGCSKESADGECLTVVSREYHYNSELIKSIKIKSLLDIEITCLDGGSTSCVLPL
jgi:hypothetical protein